MPIKRLVNRLAAFPRIGELRKGAPKPERGIGQDLKHFRFTPQPGEEGVAELFRAAYGNTPREINAYLLHEATDDNFETWQEEWVAGGLVHRCDGETCVLWLENGAYRTAPVGFGRPCPGGCKQVGRLRILVPELKRMATVLVMTTSIHDVMNLREQILQAEQTAATMQGSLKGIPFILKRRPRRISIPRYDEKTKKTTRVRAEKWLLSIEPHPDWVARLLDGLNQVALPSERRATLALPAGSVADMDNEPPDDFPYAPPATDFGAEPPFEEDDEEEDEGAAETEATSEPVRPAPSGRQRSAEADDLDLWIGGVRARVAENGSPRWRESATEAQLGAVKGLVDKAVGKEARGVLMKALFNLPQIDAIQFGQASVVIDLAQKDGQFAANAKRLVAKATGQREMPIHPHDALAVG